MGDVTCSIEGCTKARSGKWCEMHRARYRRYGDPLARIAFPPTGSTIPERIAFYGWTERQVRPGMTPCHEWGGNIAENGYPRLSHGNRLLSVHRLVLGIKVGFDLPSHVEAKHACDNPPCINPDHLSPGTHADNMGEAIRRGCSPNGERTPQHKLTDAQVAEIRARSTGASGEQMQLAREYGVSNSTICSVLRGRSRKVATRSRPVDLREAGTDGGSGLPAGG